jgi:hypothetical protein
MRVHSNRSGSDKAYQLLAHGRWFSPDTSASYTTKAGHHDIAEILLKVALSTKNQIKKCINITQKNKDRATQFYIFLQIVKVYLNKNVTCFFNIINRFRLYMV